MKQLIKKLFNREKPELLTKERRIRLITEREFQGLRDGTKLISINGTYAVKGKGDPIDTDTRMGLMAYGFEMHPKDPEFSNGWKL